MRNTKKLIEVALPLEAINKASAREKSIRHGHTKHAASLVGAAAAASGRRAHQRCSVLGMPMPNGLLARAGLIDRFKRERHFNKFFCVSHESAVHVARLLMFDCGCQPGDIYARGWLSSRSLMRVLQHERAGQRSRNSHCSHQSQVHDERVAGRSGLDTDRLPETPLWRG